MISLATLSAQAPPAPLSITAVIDTALCVGAGGSTGSLADKPIIRNAQGQLLVPGSQLKGRLRHECEKLARGLGWAVFESPSALSLDPRNNNVRHSTLESVGDYPGQHCLISRIFGNPILPAKILVDDLICPIPKEELPEVLRPGVTINRRRRVAEDQKFFLLETSPANSQLEFHGEIHLLPDLPPQAIPLILAGLRHIHALGGSKSAGLGWLTWQKIDAPEPDWSQLIPTEGGAE
ncbi:RAMP superfamily CRISPR-associated protein [Adonisia turfae]|uniref:CRISPR-associated protein Csm3 n=1 Tax=Adonisia turfae CCMR0081 TaxID=2292702 RepID=A0A6M0RSB3_9CYAN|nr:RAMP superfamily CRISPR-associated protein [Adonisia turfae]NEZ59124.1 CRISPR-associated protein Csm3 [Adonisia turfae CCMR0081]